MFNPDHKKPTRVLQPPVKQINRRLDLLPWWVKVFIVLFLVFFVVAPFGIILGLFGATFNMSLLGWETNDPLSFIGIALMLLFIYKGMVAYGLWREKDWAVGLARVDALVSIVLCSLSMIWTLVRPENHMFTLRFELVVLIPYYLKMTSIEYTWKYFGDDDEITDDQAASPNEMI